MTPLSFDFSTSREVLSDSHARLVETKAREDADILLFTPPKRYDESNTYWSNAMLEFEYQVYVEQYEKRVARNKRKLNNDRRS